MLKLHILKSKDFQMVISTDKPILDAIEDEFRKGTIKLSKIGQLMSIIHPDGEDRPIVTAPFLFGRGLLNKETAVHNVAHTLKISLKEAEELLLNHPLSKKHKT